MVDLPILEPPRLTFEDWRTLPTVKRRNEIVDGVLLTQPAATVEHQLVLRNIAFPLVEFVEESTKSGMMFFVPGDILIQRDSLRVRQPDLFYITPERTGIRDSSDLRGLEFLEKPPDIAVEVVQPVEVDWILAERIRDYQRIGVYECWLAHLNTKTLETFDLTGKETRTVGVFGIEDTFRSDLLPGFELKLREVFP